MYRHRLMYTIVALTYGTTCVQNQTSFNYKTRKISFDILKSLLVMKDKSSLPDIQ